jgi:invasion protein IalB
MKGFIVSGRRAQLPTTYLVLLDLTGAATAATLSPIESGQQQATHWTKFCSAKPAAAQPRVCVIKGAKPVESGSVTAMVIETDSTAKKLLRVILPLGTDVRQGASIVIDDHERITVPYVACENQGCVADFDASNLVSMLKHGRKLDVQGVDAQGNLISYVLPLADFGAAYDGADN